MGSKLSLNVIFVSLVLTSQVLTILPFYELIFDTKTELVEHQLEDSLEKEEDLKEKVAVELPTEYVISDHISNTIEYQIGAFRLFHVQVETPPPKN